MLLIVIIDAIFWMFRVAVTVSYSVGASIGFEPLNYTAEIVTLFLALLSIVLIAKRKLLGGLLYLLTYGAYFGVYLYKSLEIIANQGAKTVNYSSICISGIAIFLALISFVSIGITDLGKTSHSQTDWFFKNNDIQRKKDIRDDTNQYKL